MSETWSDLPKDVAGLSDLATQSKIIAGALTEALMAAWRQSGWRVWLRDESAVWIGAVLPASGSMIGGARSAAN